MPALPRFALILIAGSAIAALTQGAGATTLSPVWTLQNPAPETSGRFGEAVALDGDTAVIGAPGASAGGVAGVGRAYVVAVPSGTVTQPLINPTSNGADWFGTAVAVAGGRAVVGAPLDDQGARSGSGRAFLYDTATGTRTATLTQPAPRNGDNMGESVAISGGTVVTGAPRHNPGLVPGSSPGQPGSGSAYLYDAATGALTATLAAPDPQPQDRFGTAVAVAGGRVLVGAPYVDVPGVPGRGGDTGSVFVYDSGSGALSATLSNPGLGNGDWFGYRLAADGDRAAISAPNADVGAVAAAGAVHIFNLLTGSLTVSLFDPTPSAADGFGQAIAIWKDYAVVGAPYGGSGAAYLFRASTGQFLATLANPGGGPFFGAAVAISDHRILVGAPGYAGGGSFSGAAYLYRIAPVPLPGGLVLMPVAALALAALGWRRFARETGE